MNEMEPLEQAMSRWRPRQPSAEVAQRLFGESRKAPLCPKLGRRSSTALPSGGLPRLELWRWLTPVVACSLTILLVASSGHRGDLIVTKNGPVFIEGLLPGPSASNSTETLELTASDANVQWNSYPELVSLVTRQGGGAGNGRTGGTNLNRPF